MSINKVILIGNVGKDAELQTTETGINIAKFSVATTESFKRGENWENKTEWHNIVMFGKSAEYVKDKVKKGIQVYIEGKISTSNWQDETGKKQYKTDIIANTCKILTKSQSQNEHNNQVDNDLPF